MSASLDRLTVILKHRSGRRKTVAVFVNLESRAQCITFGTQSTVNAVAVSRLPSHVNGGWNGTKINVSVCVRKGNAVMESTAILNADVSVPKRNVPLGRRLFQKPADVRTHYPGLADSLNQWGGLVHHSLVIGFFL